MAPLNTETLLEAYTSELREQFTTGHAREHAYRPALKKLMNSFEDVTAINDPKRSDNGNPDFIFLKTSNTSIILGYAEAKDITVDILKTAKTEQLRRYAGYEKLFLTNYLDFYFYRNGELYQEISIGKIKNDELVFDPTQFERLAHELKAFIELPPETIRSGKKLALIMGGKARRIRDNVSLYLTHKENEQNQELEKIYDLMRELLVHDLTSDKFADMYAQTLVYGLFVARYNDKTPESFSRSEARDLVPASNPFLREFFDHIVGPRFDKRLAYIVDELCEAFGVSDVKLLVQKHLRLFEVENDKDPIIHFYEDFLKEYDPAERKKMGAYYTPVPVVRFIVRAVDEVLKSQFGLDKGLADNSKKQYTISSQGTKHKVDLHRVQVLDPAVGTATFLNETIKHIQTSFEGQEGRWPAYAKQELLPRLHGFELMMAPYTIAHLKLGMTLTESGVDSFAQRLGVYLTNTLEEGIKRQLDLFTVGLAEVVTQESIKAAEIKHDRPIMVVLGNPPYSGHSSNNTAYANSLVEKYKVEPGGQMKLQERNGKWLNDDYVKFIAFAEDMIDKNGEGVLAMITNNSYLDNPTFRGMRWHLCRTFDEIRVLDLHGSTKKQEIAPDGTKDENVFEIQQGVSIIIASKTSRSKKDSRLFRADMFGTRRKKFEKLNQDVEWIEFTPETKSYAFVPVKDPQLQKSYSKYISVQDLFIKNTLGFQTHRDSFAVAVKKEAILSRLRDLSSDQSNESLADKYKLKDNRDWQLNSARHRLLGHSDEVRSRLVVECAYRPFDTRYTYFDEVVSDYPRKLLKETVLNRENITLECTRQIANLPWQHAFVANKPAESCLISNKTKEGNYSFPLYIYHDDGTKTANFNPEKYRVLTKALKQSYEPIQVFDYVYGVLCLPQYREKYQEFLKSDYPRIPIPNNDESFETLSSIGKQLRGFHLLSDPELNNFQTTYPVPGANTVSNVSLMDDKLWINESQYFGNVSQEIWDYKIGSYLPAQKWLKERAGQDLTDMEVETYQKILSAISNTCRVLQNASSLNI